LLSLPKNDICNALDGNEDFVLFEESESLDNNTSDDECDSSKIFGNFMTSRSFVLHCHFVE
jgi:hypothetical protein